MLVMTKDMISNWTANDRIETLKIGDIFQDLCFAACQLKLNVQALSDKNVIHTFWWKKTLRAEWNQVFGHYIIKLVFIPRLL